ncbi:gamma-glutamyltranspeptidase 1 [Tanacetum coccineum]
MGGSASQPRTDQVHSPINAFPLKELYTPDFSESLQENISFWQAPNPYEVPVEQVATSLTKKKATRNRQKKFKVMMHPGRLRGQQRKKLRCVKVGLPFLKTASMYGHRTYDMVLGKWKTVRLSMVRFCGIYNNIMRMGPESGAGDAYYVQRAMIHYEINTGLPFKLCHCWEILKDHPKWQEIAIPSFNIGSEGGSKRHKSTGSSSFNTKSGEASINLNTNVDDNDEDEVQKIQRLEGRDKARAAGRKNKGSKSSASSSVNEDALARLMVTEMGAQEKEERLAFLEIKRRGWNVVNEKLNNKT